MSDVGTGPVDKRNITTPARPPRAAAGRRGRRSCATTFCWATADARRSPVTGAIRRACSASCSTRRPESNSRSRSLRIGGYGRKQLCLHSGHRSARALRRPPGSRRKSDLLRAILHPLWDLGLVVGHQVREIDEFARLEVGQPRVPAWRWSMRGRSPGDLALYRRFEAAFHHAGTHAHVVGALNTLIEDRHALFNPTLYQLEPDVKEAPGALRDLTAMRWIAALTDPSLLRRGPEDLARAGRGGGFSPAGPVDPAPGDEAQLEHAQPPAAGNGRRHPRVSGRVSAAARRAADERLLPPRAHRHALARLDRARRRRRRSAPTSDRRPTASASSMPVRLPSSRRRGSRPFRRRSTPSATCRIRALAIMRQHAERFRVEDFFPTPAHVAALLRFLKPGAGLYARLSEMHDCGVLGRMFPPFQAITCRVVRDFFHKYTVDEHTLLTIQNLERLATRRRRTASASRRCSRISGARAARAGAAARTTWASGATTITRSKACAWRARCSIGCGLAPEARAARSSS